MGNFLIILGFIIICSAPLHAYASELLGRISTDDPAAEAVVATTVPAVLNPAETAVSGAKAPDSGSIPEITIRPDIILAPEKPVAKETPAKVLGQKIYPDNTLVKDESGRIYLIQGHAKKPIRNPAGLGKYRGQPILAATVENLTSYQTREHLDGDLIRQKNDVKVYAIKKGLKYHILNLVELARDYFGVEIHNIEPQEMEKYL